VAEEYDVTFGPYDYSGVPRPRRLRGREVLTSFRKSDVHLNDDGLNGALERIDFRRSGHVPNVIFTDDEIARLRFAL
jgi:hypothetical protein